MGTVLMGTTTGVDGDGTDDDAWLQYVSWRDRRVHVTGPFVVCDHILWADTPRDIHERVTEAMSRGGWTPTGLAEHTRVPCEAILAILETSRGSYTNIDAVCNALGLRLTHLDESIEL